MEDDTLMQVNILFITEERGLPPDSTLPVYSTFCPPIIVPFSSVAENNGTLH